MPAVVELRKVHLAACNALHPDPVALAERLYGFQMNGQWDTFHEVLPDYAEALGDRISKEARYYELQNAKPDAMAESLAKGERIEIRGFGSFGLNYRPPRTGRNPRTGDAVEVPAKRVPYFKPGKEIRDRLND